MPDGYDSVSLVSNYLDYDQAIYQAYKRGDMPISFLQGVIQKWGVDTLNCTPYTINCYIRGMVGTRENKWFYILDEGGDGGLENDSPVELENLNGKLIGNKQHMVKFERYMDGKTKLDSTLIKVTALEKVQGEFRRLKYQYLEGRKGSFLFGNKQYEVNLSGRFNSFNYLDNPHLVIKDLTKGTTLGPFKQGGYINLGDNLLYVEQIKKDGGAILLRRKPMKNDYVGLQKGFVAPAFSGTTIDGKIVNLSDFKGAYTLVYFWNSTCRASTIRLESIINPLIKKVNRSSSELRVLGVALDFPQNVASFITDKKISLPQIITSADGPIRDLYKINHYPTIYLVDPNGRVVENSLEDPNDLEKVLFSYLNKKN